MMGDPLMSSWAFERSEFGAGRPRSVASAYGLEKRGRRRLGSGRLFREEEMAR